MWVKVKSGGELYHYGVRGQKWGVRNYQNEDGSYKRGAEGRYYQNTSGGNKSSATRKVGNLNRRGSGLGVGPVGNGGRPSDIQTHNARSSHASRKAYLIERKNSINTQNKIDDISGVNRSNTDPFDARPRSGSTSKGRGYTLQADGNYLVHNPKDSKFYRVSVSDLSEWTNGEQLTEDVVESAIDRLIDIWETYPDKYSVAVDMSQEMKNDQKEEAKKEDTSVAKSIVNKVSSAYKKASSAVSNALNNILSSKNTAKAATKVKNAVNKIGSALTSLFKKK